MVSTFFTFTVVAATLSSVVHAAGPLGKRIAQTIDQSTAQWEQACVCPRSVLTNLNAHDTQTDLFFF